MSTEAANQWIERLTALEPADGILTEKIVEASDWPAVVWIPVRADMTPEQLIDARFSAEVEALAFLKVVIESHLDMIGAACWKLERSGSDPDELQRQLASERYWKSVARWVDSRERSRY